MRRILFMAFLSVVMLCLESNILFAQPTKEAEGILTTGEAKVWIEPDRARVYLGIETMDTNINAARDTNAEKIKGVIDALKLLKIENMLIKAPNYNVFLVKEPEYDATRSGRLPKLIGYKVVQDFTVLLQNKDAQLLSKQAAQVIDTALNSGVNIIQNIEFFKEDYSADRREALKLAVKNAMENAKAIAETAGVSIKGYRTITSATSYSMHTQYNYQQSQMFRVAAASDVGGVETTLAAGKIAVTASVTIRCDIQ
jgi:hypothetical protein